MKLSLNYKSLADASGGPLGESDVGEVISDSGKRVNVKALTGAKKDKTWWYDKDAVECVSAEFIAAAKAAEGGSGNKFVGSTCGGFVLCM